MVVSDDDLGHVWLLTERMQSVWQRIQLEQQQQLQDDNTMKIDFESGKTFDFDLINRPYIQSHPLVLILNVNILPFLIIIIDNNIPL